jgi:hypothetical protein
MRHHSPSHSIDDDGFLCFFFSSTVSFLCSYALERFIVFFATRSQPLLTRSRFFVGPKFDLNATFIDKLNRRGVSYEQGESVSEPWRRQAGRRKRTIGH